MATRSSRVLSLCALALLGLHARASHADVTNRILQPPPRDVENAPLPGEESGRVDTVDEGDSLARRIARGALWLPRNAIDLALFPVRGSLWMFERYQLDDRFRRIFFNDALTMGLYPTVDLQTGFGVTVGARFVHRDLFGEREHVSLAGKFGGEFREGVFARIHSGDRFGSRLVLKLAADYERRPHDAFYGIGNSDAAPDALPMTPTDPIAVETRFRLRRERITAGVEVRPFGALHVLASGAYVDHVYGPSDPGDGTPIDSVYAPMDLAGWDGVRYVYTELELRWDSRRRATDMEPRAVVGAGGLASVFAGRAMRVDGGIDYWRYGGDAQYYLRLDEGPRVIVARAHGEAVSSRTDVPFADLPVLGGPAILRGYPLDRFRDRVALVGSLDYRWDLSRGADVALFGDIGRVYPSLRDIRFEQMRVGYGVALELHTDRGFLFEGSIGTSIDGGVQLNLALSPVFDLDPRVKRR